MMLLNLQRNLILYEQLFEYYVVAANLAQPYRTIMVAIISVLIVLVSYLNYPVKKRVK